MQAPSTVNNCAREMMASIRAQWDDAVWFNFYPTSSPTIVSLKAQNKIRISQQSAASTYTATDIYPVGTRLKVVSSNTTVYGTVSSLSSSSTAVMLTFTPDSGTLTSTITTVSRSIISPVNTPLPAAAGAAFDLVSYTANTNVTSIDITNLDDTFAAYKFVLTGCGPLTDGTDLWFRTSTNNGSSYDAGASDYGWNIIYSTHVTVPTVAAVGDDADTQIDLIQNVGNAANEKMDLELMLYRPGNIDYTVLTWHGFSIDSSGVGYNFVGSAVRLSAANVDAIRFLFSTGNINGALAVYGLKN